MDGLLTRTAGEGDLPSTAGGSTGTDDGKALAGSALEVRAATANALLPLVVDDLRYVVDGQPLVAGVSFRLDSPGCTAVLGYNGAGKSLLLRLCHGLLEPSGGRVTWAGRSPAASRGGHAMVFQRPVLLRRSALDNVVYALSLAGVGRRGARERARDALARAGLDRLAGRPARLLSGGEQQRLAIVRAWVTGPSVMLLDEPTAHLDPAATRAIEDLVRAMLAAGVKVVLTTHDLGQARRLADEVLYIHRGKLLEQGPAARFFAGPATREARAYVAGELA